MKYLFPALLILFFLPGPASASRYPPALRAAEVAVEELPVHGRPSAESEMLGALPKGKTVFVFAEAPAPEGLWCAVEFPGRAESSGFVRCRALRFFRVAEIPAGKAPEKAAPAPPAGEPPEIKVPPAFLPGAFLQALWGGDSAAVEQMLNEGIDPNRPTSLGAKALIIAARLKNPQMLRLLVEKGADLESRDTAEATALLAAAAAGLETNVEILIKAGADVNAKDNRGMNSLFWASIQGFPQIARVLLAAGADWQIRSKDGWTALQSSRAILANAQKALAAAGPETAAETLARLQSRAARYEQVVFLLERAGEQN